ncbi:MAG: class IV adenylate cyclase [Bacteroidales bacterium]
MLEREIKLQFASPADARTAIVTAGATPIRGRRLQEDCLLDTQDERVRAQRSVLRIRIEQGKSLLTFKGPVQPSPMKLRDELETVVGDGDVLLRLLQELGFTVWFRYQKYREEFAHGDVIVALDETPIGTFVEIEGGEDGITEMAGLLGRKPSDFIVESYRTLFCLYRDAHQLTTSHMVFDE